MYIDKCKNRYEGGWSDDRAQGYGTKVYHKGDRHEGLFKDDKRNGFGKYVWNNGDKFFGLWLHGMMHGRGTFVWAKVSSRDPKTLHPHGPRSHPVPHFQPCSSSSFCASPAS